MTDSQQRLAWTVFAVAILALVVWLALTGSNENIYVHIQRVILEGLS